MFFLLSITCPAIIAPGSSGSHQCLVLSACSVWDSEKGVHLSADRHQNACRACLLQALFLGHPKKKIRDTQKYKPFRTQVKVPEAMRL